MTDTLHWCELHEGQADEVNLIFQRKSDGVTLVGRTTCIRCLGLLKQANLVKQITYGGHSAYELKTPSPQPAPEAPRKQFVLKLSFFEAIWLRAQGFELLKKEDDG